MPLKPKYQKIKDAMLKKYGEKKGTQVFHAWANKQDLDVELKSYFIISEQLKALDDDLVEGYVGTGDKDTYNDILSDSCMDDMVEQIKSLPITVDDNHESFMNKGEGERFRAVNPIAKIVSAKRDSKGIKVRTELNKYHERYEEIKSSIKNGFLHSFSFAFIPVKYMHKTIEGVKSRLLEKVNLLNACYTGIPVNEAAVFTNVMLKSLNDISDFNEEEVNELIGGLSMTDEIKTEEVKEEVKEEATEETKEETPAEPAPEEKPEEKEEASEDKEEKKAEEPAPAPEKEEEKEEEEKEEASDDKNEELKSVVNLFNEKFDSFEKKLDTINEVLSSPQFKAKSEQMEKMLNEEAELKAVKNAKTTGPLDVIK